MNFINTIISDNTGLVHLILSIVALIAGTLVLLKTKGTKTHKRIGYVYAVSMMGLIITAFMLYHLYGKFGIFHWMAVVSLFTLSAGMIPILTKQPAIGYISMHYNFMYWSVIGLYCAFAAETLVRLPKVVIIDGVPATMFYKMIGVAIAIVMFFGVLFFIRKKEQWAAFDKTKT